MDRQRSYYWDTPSYFFPLRDARLPRSRPVELVEAVSPTSTGTEMDRTCERSYLPMGVARVCVLSTCMARNYLIVRMPLWNATCTRRLDVLAIADGTCLVFSVRHSSLFLFLLKTNAPKVMQCDSVRVLAPSIRMFYELRRVSH